MGNKFSLLASMCLLAALTGCEQKKEEAPPPVSVTVTPVFNGYVVDSSEIIGQAKADDDVNLGARVKGFLRKRNFTEGALVKKDELLFEIEKDQYLANVKSAKGALEKAQAQLMNTTIEYDRQAKLLKENATSKRNYDDALANKMEAEASVMDAQGQLDIANLNLSYTDVRCPFDGRVGLATYSVGNVVGPDSKKLANVVKLNPIRIAFNVSELDILRLNLQRETTNEKPGSPPSGINIKLIFQDGTVYKHSGKIGYSSNKINASTGTLLVEALFTNDDMIIVPGMYVKIRIEDQDKTPALLVPQPAVMENLAGKYVLLVGKDNIVESRQVKTGLKAGPSIQITEGLKEGEIVIIDGQQKIRKGGKVTPVQDKNFAQGMTAPASTPSAAAEKANGNGTEKAVKIIPGKK